MFRWLIISLTLLISSCSSQKVISFVNDESTFGSYNTYAIVNYKLENSGTSSDPSGIYEAIETNISDEMELRNYTLNNKKPDLLARYETISNQVTDTYVSSSYAFGYSVPMINTRTILESTLLIELIDYSTKKMVWQASIDMNQYGRQANYLDALDMSIKEIFNTYLYRAGETAPNYSLTEQDD